MNARKNQFEENWSRVHLASKEKKEKLFQEVYHNL